MLIQIGAINGREVPVKCGIPRLMKIANSITATSITGIETLLSTKSMMTNIAIIEIVFTTSKS